jgi:4-hydroxy-3-methylbut-2-enyl diphosphate reductase
VATLRERGAVFVDETDEVPEGATVIFSAHGVAPVVHEEAGRARSRRSTRPARW